MIPDIHHKKKIKKYVVCFLAIILLLFSACGIEETGRVEEIGPFKVFLPDQTWSGKKGLFKVSLRKDDHLIMKVFLKKGSLENCYRASTYLLVSTIPDSDFELYAGPYLCVGHRIKTTLGGVLVDQIFFPVSADQTLRIDFFVHNQSEEGLQKDDPEVLTIIQRLIELNGYGSEDEAVNETDNEPGIVDSGKDSGTEWTLYNNGVLHIGGSSDMVSYKSNSDYPWGKYRIYVKEIRFDEDFDEIPCSAFMGFRKLERMELPSSVKKLNTGCFYHCDSLGQIGLPEGLERIEEKAFYGCSSIKELTVPRTVKYIGEHAFCYCEDLEMVRIENGVEILGPYAFSFCDSLQKVYLPKTIKTIGAGLFFWSEPTELYYEGSESDFAMIEIEDYNEELSKQMGQKAHQNDLRN